MSSPATPLTIQNTTFYAVGNSIQPAEGPVGISTTLNFANAAAFYAKALNLVNPGKTFSGVQCVFVDTSGTDQDVIVTMDFSGQVITAKGRTQGYYPVVAPNSWGITIACSDALALVPVIFLNYTVPPGSWATQ